MQYFSGLAKLRALHILHFKNNDTCIWVMREILRFIVDNLSHHPESKLEWIAMEDDRVDHVVRTTPAEQKLKDAEVGHICATILVLALTFAPETRCFLDFGEGLMEDR